MRTKRPETVSLKDYFERMKKLMAQGRHQEVRKGLEKISAQKGLEAPVFFVLAQFWLALQDRSRAISALDQALKQQPDFIQALRLLTEMAEQQGQTGKALDGWNKLFDLGQRDEVIYARLSNLKRQVCDFDGLENIEKNLQALTDQALEKGRFTQQKVFSYLLYQDDLKRGRALARRWSLFYEQKAGFKRGVTTPLPFKTFADGPRRVGYLSGQWYSHPVTQCVVAAIEHHDRDLFIPVGIDLGEQRNDPFRRRAKASMAQWMDLQGLDAKKAAERIHDAGIDILIDLTGHTENPFFGMLAFRPAPLQLSYLGFLGTAGTKAIDGMIGDQDLLEPGDEIYFDEAVLRLDAPFITMGPAREAEEVPTTRALQGLGEDQLVLSAFNNPKKLNKNQFLCWLQVLKNHDHVVLWLYGNDEVKQNLRNLAALEGLDPEKIVFAPNVNYYHHLARLHLADLALDTYPFGGGVTTANLLWAGVPVITRKGRHPFSRMSASLLNHLGLPELVAENHQSYLEKIEELIAGHDQRRAIRQKLLDARKKADLFSPERWVRHFEKLLLNAWKEKISGR